MDDRMHYGAPAKVLHWLVLALLAVQFPIGWFMPDVHAGPPGKAMTLHISFGLTILALILLRLVWRITHLVTPESSLPPWQRVSSEGVHWLLYMLVLATTITGWPSHRVLFQSRSIADAGGKKYCRDPSDRRLASNSGVALLIACESCGSDNR